MSRDRKTVISELLQWLGEPCVQAAFVTKKNADNIAARYFATVKAIPDDRVLNLDEQIRASVEKNVAHGHIRSWKRSCACVADVLLRPRDIDGSHRIPAARSIVRLSQYVHTPGGFFGDFSSAASEIANCIWESNFLHNEATGELSLDDSLVNDDGFIELWKLAQGVPDAGRSDKNTRYMASRLLNFLCDNRYGQIYVDQVVAESLDAKVKEDARVLTRWSVASEHVQTLAKSISVPAAAILHFLEQNEFDPDVSYKPSAVARRKWFEGDWNVIRDE
jgi:hypothetical protein